MAYCRRKSNSQFRVVESITVDRSEPAFTSLTFRFTDGSLLENQFSSIRQFVQVGDIYLSEESGDRFLTADQFANLFDEVAP